MHGHQQGPGEEGVHRGFARAPEAAATGLTRLAVYRPILVVTALVATRLGSILAYFSLGVDLLPEINTPAVTVQIAYQIPRDRIGDVVQVWRYHDERPAWFAVQ